MLDLAFNHKNNLDKKYSKLSLNPERYKYLLADTWTKYTLEIEDNNWNKLQYVSLVGDEVIGYFECNINRRVYYISSLSIVNFEDKPNFVFSKDLIEFLKLLFIQYKFKKLNFTCVVGNPAERMYDKMIAKWGGRIVGIYKNDVKLLDGKVYDLKIYEIFNFML